VIRIVRSIFSFCAFSLAVFLSSAPALSQAASSSPSSFTPTHRPLEFGVIAQGGVGITEDRNDFRFFMLGGQAGKVLTSDRGPGLLHGNFEYGIQVFPFWQSYTPQFERRTCTAAGTCSAAYKTGGTYTGISITPILLRWNFTGSGHRRVVPWAQGGGGLIWTNHKYPAVGGPPYNETTNGSAANTSVWNFTPQFGAGFHYFLNPRRSIDFGANAIHISSASLGDKNPGVNASIQFSVGYTWWK
jgi:hypothetical protein